MVSVSPSTTGQRSLRLKLVFFPVFYSIFRSTVAGNIVTVRYSHQSPYVYYIPGQMKQQRIHADRKRYKSERKVAVMRIRGEGQKLLLLLPRSPPRPC